MNTREEHSAGDTCNCMLNSNREADWNRLDEYIYEIYLKAI